MESGLLELIDWVDTVCGSAAGLAFAFGGRFPVYAPRLPTEGETSPRLDTMPAHAFRVDFSDADDNGPLQDAVPLCRALAFGCDMQVCLVPEKDCGLGRLA